MGQEGYFHRRGLDKGQDACGVGFTPVIASSATLDQGAAAGHAARILRDPNNAVMFTGHMFPGTAATAIATMEKGRTIWLNDGPNVKRRAEVNCDVFRFDFSAHDRRPTILQRIAKASPAILVLHHCSPEAYQAVSADAGNFRISAEIHHGRQMNEIQL
jgi:Cft2 family RNA processing exonuclease